MDNY
ncbi:hypothetical protein F383_14245 [Gossypium arboreum]|jgi:hypothetical protein